MNITPVEIYWLTRLDEFRILFVIVLFVLIILTIANVFGGFIAMDSAHDNRCLCHGNRDEVPNDEARMRRRFSRAVKIGVAAILLGLVSSFVPSTRQMAAIIIIPKLANSEIVAEMGDAASEMVALARDWMRTLSPFQDNKEEKTK